MRARLALVLAILPSAFYAYACSSSSEETPSTEDGGIPETDGGGTTPEDGGGTTKPDGGSTQPDGSTPNDAGDAGPVNLCPGNPLLPDGGATTPDGGYLLDGGAATVYTTGENGGDFLDGPQWIDDLGGRLVFSDFSNADLRLAPAAPGLSTQLRQVSTPPMNGTDPPLATLGSAYAGGIIYSAAPNGPPFNQNPAILRTWADGGALSPLSVGTSVGSPNDLAINQGQRIYFTDPRYQSQNGAAQRGVYQMLIDGGSLTPADGGLYDVGVPNGIALSPDNKKLYVSFTGNGGDGSDARVDVFNVDASGNLSNPQPFLPTSKLAFMPDGLAVDSVGNLYVAEVSNTTEGRVEVFSPSGQKWGALVFPNRLPTSVAFGGADSASLYITTQNGEVLVFKNRCAGIR